MNDSKRSSLFGLLLRWAFLPFTLLLLATIYAWIFLVRCMRLLVIRARKKNTRRFEQVPDQIPDEQQINHPLDGYDPLTDQWLNSIEDPYVHTNWIIHLNRCYQTASHRYDN